MRVDTKNVEKSEQKKPYSTPTLTTHGDVEKLTLHHPVIVPPTCDKSHVVWKKW